MKRWLAYLLSAVLLLSLTGCAFYKENNSETEKKYDSNICISWTINIRCRSGRYD